MMRAGVLWLVYEKPPHVDAVTHPATAGDVLLVLDLLEEPEARRCHLADQLRRYLAQQEGLEPWSRPSVPCRRASGLYALVPWRLAKWLACVLRAEPARLETLIQRLEGWLGESARGTTKSLSLARME